MDQSCRLTAVAVLALAAVLTGCEEQPPSWASVLPRNSGPGGTAPAASPAVPTSDDMVVYLDASKSIQGYVAAGHSSAYAQSLRTLRDLGSLLSPTVRTSVRDVDANVGPAKSDVELSHASTDVSIYSGGETNLARAIALFGQPTVIEAAAGGRSVSRVPRFHVLVTDGVQSTDQTASDANCDSGSDQVCVRAQMSRWLRAGWAGAILGIRSEFRGTIYSEINHGVPGHPYRIAYASDPADPATMRPFYIYLFSPDRDALAELIAKFKKRLRSAGSKAEIRELPLNLTMTAGAATARVMPSRGPDIVSVEGDADSDRFTIRVDARDARANAASSITLRVHVPWSADALDMGSPRELARLVAWDAVPIGATAARSDGRRRVPQIRIEQTSFSDDGTIQLTITPVWPAGTGERSWAAYTLRGSIRTDDDAPPWIRAWSTDLDDAPQYGNRTLFLENAALGIWRSGSGPPQQVARLFIRIGP